MKKILIVGLPFFPHKYQYVMDAYEKLGVNVKVLINSDGVKVNPPEKLYFSGSSRYKRVIAFLKVIKEFKPDIIDIYDYSIFTVFYTIFGRMLGVNTRLWLIGGELVGDKQNTNDKSLKTNIAVMLKKYLTWISLLFINQIYAKENHHLESIRRVFPSLLTKTVSIYNGIPVEGYSPILNFALRSDFIYANAVIKERNVIDLVKSFHEMITNEYEFTASIYGFNSIANEVYVTRGTNYSEAVIDLYNELGIGSHVKSYGFVSDIKTIMDNYKFFVLPANVILANYALLEAMSKGLVPIVYPGNGYEEIIEDGLNGIVAFNNNLTDALVRALSLSEEEFHSMSKNAYETIKLKFSIDTWSEKLSKGIK